MDETKDYWIHKPKVRKRRVKVKRPVWEHDWHPCVCRTLIGNASTTTRHKTPDASIFVTEGQAFVWIKLKGKT